MILHKDFIWLHLPRTGGTSTASWLRKVDLSLQLDLFITPQDQPAKHDNLAIRSLRLGSPLESKIVAINFRPLPSWLLSNYHYALNAGLNVPFERYLEGEFFSLRLGKWCIADWWLEYFDINKVTHFINTQALERDWRKLLNTCGINVPKEIRMEKENYIVGNLGSFDPLGYHNWDPAYLKNPLWQSIEKIHCYQ